MIVDYYFFLFLSLTKAQGEVQSRLAGQNIGGKYEKKIGNLTTHTRI